MLSITLQLTIKKSFIKDFSEVSSVSPSFTTQFKSVFSNIVESTPNSYCEANDSGVQNEAENQLQDISEELDKNNREANDRIGELDQCRLTQQTSRT